MALPPNFLDELRARTPLAPLITRATRLTRSGRNWKGNCPFHNEKSPSFYVYDDHFHCFGCGAHGDAISFVMQREGAGFMEAVERLATEAGLEVPKPSPEAARREAAARDIHAVLAAAEAEYARRLRTPEGRPALDYLERRGLTPETIARFGLGWSGEGRGALAAALKPHGIEQPQLIEAGLMQAREDRATDLFFNRVMFPIRDRRGRTISFGGRTLGDARPKYVNGPETAVFSKRRNLYGLDLAREAVFRGARLVVAEGYMDVIALHQAGFGGAVAPLGTALTEEQLEALWAVSPEPVLCLDGDAAGARAMARVAELALPMLSPERTLRFATLPPGEDPDTLLRQGAPAMQSVLDAARPLADSLFDMLRAGRALAGPEERAALRKRLEEAAATIKDRALASEYRRALLDRYFQGFRRGAAPAVRSAPRPVPGAAQREAQARMLLAVLVAHRFLLAEAEEALAMLELPEGPAARLQAALLAGEPDPVDAPWASAAPALPAGARPDAMPAEAAACFWHFFTRLRGDADLAADLQAAQAAATAEPTTESLRRVALLKQAADAYRSGEAEAEAG
jgi:DNA primase